MQANHLATTVLPTIMCQTHDILEASPTDSHKLFINCELVRFGVCQHGK